MTINHFKNKKIMNAKINRNCFLFFEEKDPYIIKDEKEQNFIELIENESKLYYYFDKSFEIPSEFFYLLIKNHPYFLENQKKNNNYYTQEHLKDIFYNKLSNEIDKILKPLYILLSYDDNYFENYFKGIKCQYCKKINNNSLYYFTQNYNLIYFHEECKRKKEKMKLSDTFPYKNINDNKRKIIEYRLYDFYIDIKKKILKEKSIFNEILEKKLFPKCEETKVNFIDLNISKIEPNIILKKIKEFKNIAFNEIYKDNKKKKQLIEKELDNYEKNKNKHQEWKKKMKEDINDYFNKNINNISKYIFIKSYTIKSGKENISYIYTEKKKL